MKIPGNPNPSNEIHIKAINKKKNEYVCKKWVEITRKQNNHENPIRSWKPNELHSFAQ